MPADGMGAKLKCIRLKWERHEEEKEGREKGKVFAFCLLERVRGRVHFVRFNALFQLLHDKVPYKTAVNEPLNTTSELQSDIFYVRSFYCNEDY